MEDREIQSKVINVLRVITVSLRPLSFTDFQDALKAMCEAGLKFVNLLAPAIEAGTKRVLKTTLAEVKEKCAPLQIGLATHFATVKAILSLRVLDPKEDKDAVAVQDTIMKIWPGNDLSHGDPDTYAKGLALHDCVTGIMATSVFANLVSANFAQSTPESTKSFPLTNYASASVDDTIEIARCIGEIQKAASTNVLPELPTECGTLIDTTLKSAKIVAMKLFGKLENELTAAICGRGESSDFVLTFECPAAIQKQALAVTVAAVSEIRNKTDLEFSGTIFGIRNATKLKLVE